MRRIVLGLVVLAMTVASFSAGSVGSERRSGRASADVDNNSGRLAYYRQGPATNGDLAFTINPDGSRLSQLTSATASHPHWSPDGSEIAVDAEIDSPTQPSAVIINADTGARRDLTGTLGRVCTVWSPDGSRLACNGDAEDPALAGVYTIRSSDGGGLTQVTDFSGIPGDYSPDGRRLVLVGVDRNGVLRMFVVGLNGAGLRALTPPSMTLFIEDGGSWSPNGKQITFSGHPDGEHRSALWVVHPDGSGLHEIDVADCGGAYTQKGSAGCFFPSWSPDGTRIAFDRVDPGTGQRNIFTARADGAALVQVTHGAYNNEDPDWGTHPATH